MRDQCWERRGQRCTALEAQRATAGQENTGAMRKDSTEEVGGAQGWGDASDSSPESKQAGLGQVTSWVEEKGESVTPKSPARLSPCLQARVPH